MRGSELDRDDPYRFLATVTPPNIPEGIGLPAQYFRGFFTIDSVRILFKNIYIYIAFFNMIVLSKSVYTH